MFALLLTTLLLAVKVNSEHKKEKVRAELSKSVNDTVKFITRIDKRIKN